MAAVYAGERKVSPTKEKPEVHPDPQMDFGF
jgi:hypothetical protein